MNIIRTFATKLTTRHVLSAASIMNIERKLTGEVYL